MTGKTQKNMIVKKFSFSHTFTTTKAYTQYTVSGFSIPSGYKVASIWAVSEYPHVDIVNMSWNGGSLMTVETITRRTSGSITTNIIVTVVMVPETDIETVTVTVS